MNKEYLAGVLGKLKALGLGNTPVFNEDILDVWAECLDDIKSEVVALALKHFLKNGTSSGFFPSAPEFRKICLKFQQDNIEQNLDKAWKAFKSFVPNLQGVAGERQAKLLASDINLQRCIEAFHSDWSNAPVDSSSYWYKIFAENYLNASTNAIFSEGRQRLASRILELSTPAGVEADD